MLDQKVGQQRPDYRLHANCIMCGCVSMRVERKRRMPEWESVQRVSQAGTLQDAPECSALTGR
jgi:hypothetical protein